jgi:hypothetical protein
MIVDKILSWISLYKKLTERLSMGSSQQDHFFEREGETLSFSDTSSRNTPDRVFPIDMNLRLLFELSMDTNLSETKIHLGPEAEELTRTRNADAVTQGNDIYFSAGKFSDQTDEGLALLSHELVHVKQYNDERTMRFQEDRESLEHEAYRQEVSPEFSQKASLSETDLTGFVEAKREIVYVIHMESGIKIYVKAREYDDFIEQVKSRVLEDLDTDLRFLRPEAKMEIMERLMGRGR